MGWRERDWAKRDVDEPEYQDRPRLRSGKMFPDPIRTDAAWERERGRDYGDDAKDEKAADRYASWMQLIDIVREKTARCIERFNCDNPQAAALLVDLTHKLTVTAANARFLDGDPTPPPSERGDDDE